MKQISEDRFILIPEYDGELLFSRSDIKRLIRPIIAEALLSYLIGLADSVMVASAGETAVSAVSLVDSIMVLLINVFMALGAGGAAVCGQYLGKKDEKTSRDAAGQMMVLMVVISAVIAILMLVFRNPVLNFLFGSAEEAVVTNCRIYYRIVMFSVPFIALYNGGAALFITTGDSKTPLKISVLMNIMNISGNAVLIYVFKMGVAGAAIPTLVSRIVAMALLSVRLMRKGFTLNLREIVRYRFDSKLTGSIISIGVPGSIENGMFQFGKLILMSLVSTLPTSQITANAIGNATGTLHLFVALSVNTAITAVVSRCAGAKDYKQARWYVKYFVRYEYLVQGIVNVILMAAIPLITRLYGVTGETARYASMIMLIHSSSTLLFHPWAFLLNNAMRAAGDSKYAMVVASLSMWIVRVGGAYLAIKGFGCSVVAIWVVWVIDWFVRIAFFVPRYRSNIWETKSVV